MIFPFLPLPPEVILHVINYMSLENLLSSRELFDDYSFYEKICLYKKKFVSNEKKKDLVYNAIISRNISILSMLDKIFIQGEGFPNRFNFQNIINDDGTRYNLNIRFYTSNSINNSHKTFISLHQHEKQECGILRLLLSRKELIEYSSRCFKTAKILMDLGYYHYPKKENTRF